MIDLDIRVETPEYLQESLIDDVAKNVTDVSDQTTRIDTIMAKNKVSTNSIVARAKNSVLQFPMYISRSLRINEAHIISKTFERVYASLVQSVLSQNVILDEKDANELVFLKQFHTNLKEATEAMINKYYEPIDDFDKMMGESIFHSAQLTNNLYVEFRAIPAIDEDLLLEHARMMHEPLRGFTYLYEAPEDSHKAPKPPKDPNAVREPEASRVKLQDPSDPASGKRVGLAAATPSAPRLLNDADIKKVNGMVPFTIEATFRLKSEKGDLDRDVKYILGVKTVLHEISPLDLARDLREIIAGDVKKLQNVRYKTGEITFKDYLFNIKGLKSDAAKHINYDKRWLNTLKRLGEYNKIHGSALKNFGVKAIAGGEVPIPNGTLVLSDLDVTDLTNRTGIDLSLVSNAKLLGKSLFLVGIVIVNMTKATMKVLFVDNDVEWDVQSLDSLGAELAKTDNSALFKELQHKINR